MTNPVRASVPALFIAVMATVLVGALTGTNRAEAVEQQTLRIPAAAFGPTIDTAEYHNDGRLLRNNGSATTAFVAPVILEGDIATIHSVRLHYRDNGNARVCASVFRPNLKTGVRKTMSSMCTWSAVDDVRTRVDTTISPDELGRSSAVYVYVTLPPGGKYGLYGVTVDYTPNVASG